MIFFGLLRFRLYLPLAGGLLSVSTGCKWSSLGSKQKSIESDDWFKDGKDRFYLAQLRTDGFIEGTKLPKGSELLVGLGCVGEPVDWQSPDPKDPKRGLHQRRYYNPIDPRFSDFPIGVPQHLKKNECAVLLGSQQGAEEFIKKESEAAASPLLKVEEVKDYGMTAWAMWTCANDIGVTAAIVGSGGIFAPEALAAAALANEAYTIAKQANSAGKRAARVVKKLVDATAEKGIAGAAEPKVVVNVGLAAAGLNDPLTSLLFKGTSLLGGFSGCGETALALGLNVQAKKGIHNRFVFMESFAKAMEFGKHAIIEKYPQYADLENTQDTASTNTKADGTPERILSKSEQVKMDAELNSAAVLYFNSEPGKYKFEQGWLGNQDFFKTVKDINEEMNAARTKPPALSPKNHQK